MTSFFSKEFVHFIVVGMFNAIFWYMIFSLLIFFEVQYALAVFCATFIGILFNFKTFGILVFKSNDNSLIFRFFFVYLVIYGINVLMLFVLENIGSENMYINGLIITPIAAILSYIFNKFFVFKREV